MNYENLPKKRKNLFCNIYINDQALERNSEKKMLEVKKMSEARYEERQRRIYQLVEVSYNGFTLKIFKMLKWMTKL